MFTLEGKLGGGEMRGLGDGRLEIAYPLVNTFRADVLPQAPSPLSGI